MTNNYKLYKLTLPNRKIYIGITKQKLSNRWCNGKGYQKNKKLYKDIQKYKWENVKHELILDNLSKEEAYKLEMYLIKNLKSNDEKIGYNIDPGGTGTGRISPMKGKKDTEETKKKKSISHKGKKAYWYGKKMPKEATDKMRLSKLGKYNGKDNPFSKIVYQYDLNNNFIKKWDCIEDAGKHIKRCSSNITACCKGRQKTCGGYKWSYKELEG